MRNQQVRETLNDGVLSYGYVRTSRNAARKVTGSTFEKVGVLFYRQLSVRESDHIQYGANGKSIDMKVKTLAPPFFKQGEEEMVVQIGEQLYNVLRVDPAKNNLFLYLHLIEGDISGGQNEAAD